MKNAASKSFRDRIGLAPKAAAPVIKFPEPPPAKELTDLEREAFAIELIANPAERALLNEQRQRREIFRLGIVEANKQRADGDLPPLPVPPEGQSRPYFVGTFASAPPREQVVEVLGAAGLTAESMAELITPGERKWLRKMQAKINEANDQMRGLDVDGIRHAARLARHRLEKGKGSVADASFDKGNLVQARKQLRKQKDTLIAECRPTLVEIAERIQQAARKALPIFEAEAARLRINPALLPMVQAAAWLSYRPVEAARTALLSPKTWLKHHFGIRL